MLEKFRVMLVANLARRRQAKKERSDPVQRPERSDPIWECIEYFYENVTVTDLPLPVFIVAISTNGAVGVWCSVQQGGPLEILCHRWVDQGPILPIVISAIALDGRGMRARIVQGENGVELEY